jgi:hypothetical protein
MQLVHVFNALFISSTVDINIIIFNDIIPQISKTTKNLTEMKIAYMNSYCRLQIPTALRLEVPTASKKCL